MNPYTGTVRALGRTKSFSWVASRVLPPLDRRFVGRRRAPSSLGTGFPLCYLVVRSRKTGEPRTVPLLHVSDGERVVLIASNWGRRNDPAWAFDLEAHPNASVVVSGVDRWYRARRATADESGRYWERALAVWPGYGDYRKRAGREIRMFVLEPYSE